MLTADTPLNINSAVRVLRKYCRGKQADTVIANYIAAHEADGPDFFDIRRHHFSRDDLLDDALRDAFEGKRDDYLDARDPLAVLTAIGERCGWTGADLMLMVRESPDDFEPILETLRGDAPSG